MMILRISNFVTFFKFLRAKINIQSNKVVYGISIGFMPLCISLFGFSFLTLILLIITFLLSSILFGEIIDFKRELLRELTHTYEESCFYDLEESQQRKIMQYCKGFIGQSRGNYEIESKALEVYRLIHQNKTIKEILDSFEQKKEP